MWPASKASPFTAMPNTARNTTIATPSLNSDSPAILISSDLLAPAVFRMPMTAIGSVGEISAPNSRQ